jgi:YD repeat-containing protein
MSYSQWNKPEEATDDNLTLNDCIKLKYDRQGRMTEYSKCNKYGEEISTDQIKYDANGHMLERHYFPPVTQDLPLTARITLQYDSLGRCASLTTYTLDGNKYAHVVYLYDAKNQCIERDEYFKDTLPGVKYIYQYNDKGLYIGELIYRHDKAQYRLNQRLSYEYDSNGNELTKRSYLTNDSLAWQISCQYDQSGNIIHSERYSHINTSGHYDPIAYRDTTAFDTYWYKYDKYGNWTRETVSRRGKIGFKYERTIKYYR